MQTVIIYDSRFGNTEQIAKAIARGARARSDVHVMHTTEALRSIPTSDRRPDLVIVGGPTHNRGPSAGLKAFAQALPAALRTGPVATFDTRYRGPLLVMGSAAAAMSKTFAKAGAALVAPPESFFIVRKGSVASQGLEPGELERAEQWGVAVSSAVASALGARAGVLAG